MKRRTRLNRLAKQQALHAQATTNQNIMEALYAELQMTPLPNSYANEQWLVRVAQKVGANRAVAYLMMAHYGGAL